MANTLRIKRRLTGVSGAPGSLANAELAFNEVNDTLYYGKGSNDGVATSVIAIGGPGTFATKTYVDNAVSGAAPTGVAYLDQNNSYGASYTNTFNGAVNLEGAFQIDGVTVNTSAAELNVLDGVTAGTATANKALVVDANKDINLDTGDLACTDVNASGNVVITGNLTVNGTTTTINSTTVSIDDKLFELGATANPTDAGADGGGVSLKGATDKTITWVLATTSWTSSEHFNLVSGKAYYINGAQVLSGSALGTGVTGSSLTSVGTLSTGVWQGTAVGVAYGGTGATDAAAARTNLGVAIGSDVQAYDATLAGLASVTVAADKLIYATGADAFTTADLTSFARTLLDDTGASDARTTLGLGSIATQNANNVSITGGSIDNVTFDGGSF
jgi:hypothetical protein